MQERERERERERGGGFYSLNFFKEMCHISILVQNPDFNVFTVYAH